jgi:hypothetical protein
MTGVPKKKMPDVDLASRHPAFESMCSKVEMPADRSIFAIKCYSLPPKFSASDK